MLENQHPSK